MSYDSIAVHFTGPELTPALAKELNSCGFASGYEDSPLAKIMDGPDGDFGYDRFETDDDGVLWGAIDGISPEYIACIIAHFTKVAADDPNRRVMLVGETHPDEDEDDSTMTVVFSQGFTKETDPSGYL